MRDPSQEMVKARCDTIGTVFRILFWAYGVYLLMTLTLGVWMVFQPETGFTIHLTDTGRYIFLNGMWGVNFPLNGLTKWMETAPKLAYLLQYGIGLLHRVLTLGVLWNLRNIFRRIDHNCSPFLPLNSRAVFRIGMFVIGDGLLIGGLDWWSGLLIGGTIMALAAVFDYGAVLQQESDETL